MLANELTAEQSACETANRQNGDVHLLPADQELLVNGIVPVLPEGMSVVPNVAVHC